MRITDVQVHLNDSGDTRLQAFCSITIDDAFIVRDVKVIDGPNGVFVAMPSRSSTHKCDDCGNRNDVRSSFCNRCGVELEKIEIDEAEPFRGFVDIAHPTTRQCRERIQQIVLGAVEFERQRAGLELARY